MFMFIYTWVGCDNHQYQLHGLRVDLQTFFVEKNVVKLWLNCSFSLPFQVRLLSAFILLQIGSLFTMMNKLIFSTIRVPRLSVNAPKLFSTTSWNHDAGFSFWEVFVNVTECDNFSVTVPVDYMPDKLFKQIDLELRAHEPSVLKSYSWFAGKNLIKLMINICQDSR